MSESVALRQLPPVEPVEIPKRLSQTFLSLHDRCTRAAYLYAKYRGGGASHAMDRGSLYHAFAERLMYDLIARGEKTLYAAAEGEDPVHAAREVASLTAAMVDGILAERPDLTVPRHEKDDVREMAYHTAIGLDVDPETVVAVERKFVLDLDCGWTVSGKVDLASLPDPQSALITDWKTAYAVPPQGDFEESYQVRFYALLLAFGQPVEVVAGEERRGDPIGEYLQWFKAREVYPRYLSDDGQLRERAMVLSRQELSDFRADVNAQVERVTRQFETWEFPAVAGSQCAICPCSVECPLPGHLRRHAGTINTVEEAREAAELVARTVGWQGHPGGELTATKKEITTFAGLHGPIRYGTDRVLEFVPEESWSTKWDDLEVAIERARLYGEPFDLAAYRKPRLSTKFRSRKLTAAELAEIDDGGADDDGQDPDARWGADAPF